MCNLSYFCNITLASFYVSDIGDYLVYFVVIIVLKVTVYAVLTSIRSCVEIFKCVLFYTGNLSGHLLIIECT